MERAQHPYSHLDFTHCPPPLPTPPTLENRFHAIFIATGKANKCHGFSASGGRWQKTPNIM